MQIHTDADVFPLGENSEKPPLPPPPVVRPSVRGLTLWRFYR